MNDVEGLLNKPEKARFLYVLGHGAGAGMRHPFMEDVAERLAERRVATFRYEFPYMADGKRRPDPPRILQATVRSAVESAGREAAKLPLIAGGKSMGGRMTSMAAASDGLRGVQGLVFLGFPLHAPGKVDNKRAEHLAHVDLPMLFIQGTRDSLADMERIEQVCDQLGSRATLHVVDGGDHSFKVLKRSGRDPSDVMDEIADAIALWGEQHI